MQCNLPGVQRAGTGEVRSRSETQLQSMVWAGGYTCREGGKIEGLRKRERKGKARKRSLP